MFYVPSDQREGRSAFCGSLPLLATRLTTCLILLFLSETSAGFGRCGFSNCYRTASPNSHLAVIFSMDTPQGPRTRARARKLATIFDDVGALNAATPNTPHLASGESEASAAAATLLQRLRRDSFDVQCAKTAATKVLGEKSAKFKGSETSASDIFTQLVSEVQQLFTLQSTAFAPMFDLTAVDTPVLSAANELLYSVLLLLTAPGSPARNWVEASGADVPADGKRATLEVVRMLADVSAPFDAFAELLAVGISDERDPDPDIRLFNSCPSGCTASADAARRRC